MNEMTETGETLAEQTDADTLIYKFATLACSLVEAGKQRGACDAASVEEKREQPEMIYDFSPDDDESARLYILPDGLFQGVFETPDFCVGMEVAYNFACADAIRVRLAHFSGKMETALNWAFKVQDVLDDMLVDGFEQGAEQ